ncbi:ATP-binding protein [Kribbella sandramycini]|uniref:ATP-binding protein n=1 Tax=Kribbella sandramycini TaxID=60450 RepID=A0A7Y4KYI0_9ACTN|nr:ATP-binding protein [Kribbella sandramycini]MBB6569155.1 SpoVK/Ycf46/Vps4 family AAA+-type ATPase [Kribbella sandramycini]NOL41004.1 ATP-binding protein [Kribbella sandramycini]
MSTDRIGALRKAVEASPDDVMLRLLLAESLAAADQSEAALDQYVVLLDKDGLPDDQLVPVGELAAKNGRLALVRSLLETARQKGVVEGTGRLQQLVDEMITERSGVKVKVGPEAETPFELDTAKETTTFDQVGGMEEIKKVIHRLVILPLSRPDLYAKYGRKSGGGVLLYGPPGCGKTLLARATAGECGLPFVNVRIEDVMDPYLGVSERNLHAAFERARANAPCVLFLDELDALAFARHKHGGSEARRLVDVLLQELDAIGSENDGLLVLAATNAPWDVDEAMLRPGRFDRVIFVPPPDEPARNDILTVLTKDVPAAGLDLKALAAQTPMFSGADLRALIERGVDRVIDEALAGGGEPPLGMQHLADAITTVKPSTLEWLHRVRSYIEFANQSERYDDVATYLKSRDVRRRLNRDAKS